MMVEKVMKISRGHEIRQHDRLQCFRVIESQRLLKGEQYWTESVSIKSRCRLERDNFHGSHFHRGTYAVDWKLSYEVIKSERSHSNI